MNTNEPCGPYWFPAKRYGWGWSLPTVWQGWVVLVLYALAVVGIVRYVPPTSDPVAFIVSFTLATAVFILICWYKGEPPSWRWGAR